MIAVADPVAVGDVDAVGGAATGRLADGLCESATLVSYGRMGSEACAIQPDAFVFRDLTVREFGSSAGIGRSTSSGGPVGAEIAGPITAARLHAPIHATYDVSEIKDAVAVAASGGRSGKILIVPQR